MSEFCPRCAEPRVGAFRYCRRCGFDFDAPPTSLQEQEERGEGAQPEPPSVAAATPAPVDGWQPPAKRRGRWPRYVVIGVAALVGLSALGNVLSPENGDGIAVASTSPTPRSASPSVSARPETAAPTSTLEPQLGPTGPTETGTVSRVTDGDTIRVQIDGVDVPVRYIGVDTPEPDDPDPTVQTLADAATAANAALVDGRDVILERDVSDTDRFDRLLRDVWVEGPDGNLVHVGLELVRTGFAQVSTFPPDVKYIDLLLEEQERARSAALGLWAPAPTPAPTESPAQETDDTLVFVGPEESTKFRGSTGDYTWSSLVVDGDRLTVRWDVRAEAEDCQVRWRLEPIGSEPLRSTVRVTAGDRERGNSRFDVDYEDAAFVVTSTCPSWLMSMQTSVTETGANCDDSYVGVCIPPYPPDLDCGDIVARDFTVRGSDPHGFDGDGDGIGCQS